MNGKDPNNKCIKIINVVGARPNFIKISPLISVMNQFPDYIKHILVHTGQHYDLSMNQTFFDDLDIPQPDINLEAGSGSHAEQTGQIMMSFEQICIKEKPDLVIVVGDVNSTLACTLTAKKLGIKTAHVEAGLRSRDMSMPEEINRLCTDIISDYLFTPDKGASKNLKNEGISDEKIFFVGNIMIDTLNKYRDAANNRTILEKLGLQHGNYATLTLHRPSNVDDSSVFREILDALNQISDQLPIIFPVHPRTRKFIKEFGYKNFFNEGKQPKGIWMTEPLGYLDFLHLNMHARLVFTDSGGLQEETTVLGIPCVTLRQTTERPITCTEGTNHVVGNDKETILNTVNAIFNEKKKEGKIPEKWDGRTAERIVNIIIEKECNKKIK